MTVESNEPKNIITLNKYGLHLRWPRIWIIILGIILIFLCFCIAGMEIGNTVFDLRRATTFGGFIVFIPLLICAIFILITAFKPRLILLRIALILCCIMIILCFVLIAYDILVLVDPTRCFFFDCSTATVNASNSTTIVIVSGWPLSISWPNYFLINMNAKRIFQGVQLFCASLFILFCLLYILTYMIYRKIRLHQETIYNADRHTLIKREATIPPKQHSDTIVESNPQNNLNNIITTYIIEGNSTAFTKKNSSLADQNTFVTREGTRLSRKRSNTTIQSHPQNNLNQLVTTYFIEGHSNSFIKNNPSLADQRTLVTRDGIRTSTKRSSTRIPSHSQNNLNHLVTTYTIEGGSNSFTKHNSSLAPAVVYTMSPRKIEKKPVVRSRTNSVNYERICTRCLEEPRMLLTSHYEKQNYFSHLCINCNNEILNSRRKPSSVHSATSRTWKPY